MSCYENIYNDFPLRCAELWNGLRDLPIAKEFDVTFMLMAAAAGFATPWEQLRIQPGQQRRSADHPAFYGYDSRAYKRSLIVVDGELNRHVPNGELFGDANLSEWLYGKVDAIGDIRDVVEVRSLPFVDMHKITGRTIVRVLRNAIAHNNIYAFSRRRREGEGLDQRISDLVFFSEIKNMAAENVSCVGYNIVSMPVFDFYKFIDAWFTLLRRVRPAGAQLRLVVADALAEQHERVAA